jgi:hypothetical protein
MSKNINILKSDKSEKNEKVNFVDVGLAVVRGDDTINKGPLYHIRNKTITEEEKSQFIFRKMSLEYLQNVIDHDTSLRFLMNDY